MDDLYICLGYPPGGPHVLPPPGKAQVFTLRGGDTRHHLQQWGHLHSGSATRGKQASLTTVRAPTTVGAPTVHSFSPSSVQ